MTAYFRLSSLSRCVLELGLSIAKVSADVLLGDPLKLHIHTCFVRSLSPFPGKFLCIVHFLGSGTSAQTEATSADDEAASSEESQKAANKPALAKETTAEATLHPSPEATVHPSPCLDFTVKSAGMALSPHYSHTFSAFWL